METKEWHGVIDKRAYGEGPWMGEPDKIQYPDPYTQLPCLIVRNRVLGNLCGYVGVTSDHWWFGKSAGDIDISNLRVHGGITFTGECLPTGHEGKGICHVPGLGETAHVWWFGFDCAHPPMDYLPASMAVVYGGASWDHNMVLQPGADNQWQPADPGSSYRNVAYIKQQNAVLAAQIQAANGTAANS